MGKHFGELVVDPHLWNLGQDPPLLRSGKLLFELEFSVPSNSGSPPPPPLTLQFRPIIQKEVICRVTCLEGMWM